MLCVFDKERERGGERGRGIQPHSTANWGLLPRNVDNRNTLPLTLTVRFMLVINARVQSIYPPFIILQLGVIFTGTNNHFLVPTWCIFVAFCIQRHWTKRQNSINATEVTTADRSPLTTSFISQEETTNTANRPQLWLNAWWWGDPSSCNEWQVASCQALDWYFKLTFPYWQTFCWHVTRTVEDRTSRWVDICRFDTQIVLYCRYCSNCSY